MAIKEEEYECLWDGDVVAIPHRHTDRAVINIVNQYITPVSTMRYRTSLVSEDGVEVLPCQRCLRRRFTSAMVYRKLSMRIGMGIHPVLEYDVEIVCDGTSGHRSGRPLRLFFERCHE